jgi:hypothetical protein
MIAQWHRQLQFVIRFIQAMEATVTFNPRERWDAYGVANTSQVPAPPANNRGPGSRAAQAPTHFTTGGRSSNQPPRAQPKRAAGPPAPFRQQEHPAARDSQPAPRSAPVEVGCEGCGRKGHTAEQCRCSMHPNWNADHATVKWKDTAVAKEINSWPTAE